MFPQIAYEVPIPVEGNCTCISPQGSSKGIHSQTSCSPAVASLRCRTATYSLLTRLVYPYDFRLTEKEKTNICYLSFPDSYSGGLGDTQFSFRLRQSGGQRNTRFGEDGEYNTEAPLTLQRESAHYFGYVYFRQVKDSSMKRGYFQKSLVLVSRLPYVNLFQSLLQLIAPEYFDKLEPCLEAVCNEIDQWLPPVPGQTLNLPVMGIVIQVRIPSRVDKPGSSPLKQINQENLLPAPLVLPSVYELDLFRCFQPVLIHIQMLWELMLLGEPVVVMAPSPAISSEMVLALTRPAPLPCQSSAKCLDSRCQPCGQEMSSMGDRETGLTGFHFCMSTLSAPNLPCVDRALDTFSCNTDQPQCGYGHSRGHRNDLNWLQLSLSLKFCHCPCFAVCNEIDQWLPPVPGQTLNLPVMGIVIQVRIPSRVDKPGSSPLKQINQENLLPAPLVLPSVYELDLFRCFQPVLIHIQMLWELMLLGEPVVVMAPSPAISSEMVLALTSCLAPLKYCCDYRPYFTIHDSEFKEYTTRTQAPPNVVVGVTNPFFIKTLQHWPHLLRIGELKMSGDFPKQVKVKKLTKLKPLDTKPGIYTSYKTFLHKDKTLIKRLLKGIQRKRPSEVQSALLRRHLLELTQSFIIPLEHYIASLMPLQKAITPWKNPPQIRPFRQEDFMKTLEHAGPQLTCVLRGDWLGLYRRFFRSPNFDGWYRQRHKEMTQKLEALHLEAICEADIVAWMKDKSEVEIVDLVLKLREKLVRARCHHLPVKEETLQRGGLYIETIIGSLPEDLQAVLHHP
nr:protein DENND6B [Pelodiscus sinensis]|eukprot:XP_014426408.1 protein DENND6B [Pelodiscus sinensis]